MIEGLATKQFLEDEAFTKDLIRDLAICALSDMVDDLENQLTASKVEVSLISRLISSTNLAKAQMVPFSKLVTKWKARIKRFEKPSSPIFYLSWDKALEMQEKYLSELKELLGDKSHE